jgi:hypothetical protein
MHIFLHLLEHALLDSLKLLPFLFAAYLLMEALEHHSSQKMENALGKMGPFGPAVGAVLGCIPQCGFSASASNLYAAGIISQGTLLAVFLSTSDEAIPLLLANPDGGSAVLKLLIWKVIIAVVFGFLVDFFLKLFRFQKAPNDLCKDCGCDKEEGILKPALHHTIHIFIFIFVINFCLTGAIELLGEERISSLLLSGSIWQPFAAALIGLIPNCAASVMLTQLYLAGTLSFGSVIAGLSAGAGIGLAVLLKANRCRRENIQIILTLYGIAALTGFLLQLLGI